MCDDLSSYLSDFMNSISRLLNPVLSTSILSMYKMTTFGAAAHSLYTLRPLKLGAEVRDIDLKTDQPLNVIEQIIRDVHKYRLLVFRGQGIISGDRHVEISKWFGELESTFYKHPKSPHPEVFRVSNDQHEGCTGVGRTGWHIDGSFQPAPFTHSLYHMVNIPQTGNTVFAPLNDIVRDLSPDKRARWDRLWMVCDRRGNQVHPVVYSHPVTGQDTLCFHLGMTEAFMWISETGNEKQTDAAETKQILQEIHHEFVKNDGAIQYSHDWEHGDFIISDNLAVGHEATPETQYPVSEVGLRILHRTTIKGKIPPTKRYDVTGEAPPTSHQHESL